MLGAQIPLRTIAGLVATTADLPNSVCSISSSLCCPSHNFSFHVLGFNLRDRCRSKSFVVNCNYSRGGFYGKSNYSGNELPDDDYIEASVLISETVRHHRMRMSGFQEDMKWHSSAKLHSFPFQVKDLKGNVTSIGQGFLRRFHSPTIFLKISCDGDFLLPIIVGEYAVQKLIDSLQDDESGDCPNLFQLVKNLVRELGYEVKMVRITERVINTYFARIYFYKPGETDILVVDARPSDAINVARWCRAPIYVNKQIVLMDAIRIAYGMGRMLEAKSIYDVTLDSAADGPNLLAEELGLVRSLNLAVKEERYSDAAMWREKLVKLRESMHEL